MLHDNRFSAVNPRREATFTLVALLLTIGLAGLAGAHLANVGAHEFSTGDTWPVARFLIFVAVIAGFLYGSLIHFGTRFGYFRRLQAFDPREHQPDLTRIDAKPLEPVVVLVPSYREDETTIRHTLISATLQDHPDRRVVLLLDDPPRPSTREDWRALQVGRGMADTVTAFLEPPLADARRRLAAFEMRAGGGFEPRRELRHLLDAIRAAERWFQARFEETRGGDHATRLFGRLVYLRHAALLRHGGRKLLRSCHRRELTEHEVRQLYRRVVQQFEARIDVFERKRYVNLSWESNKAANLNSFIDLIGRTWREKATAHGTALVEANPGEAGAIAVPDASYVITLDADSLIAPDYARRLVGVMEAPGNERVAVAQTPYSAIPDAPSVIERVAGATTDVQYIVHQGFTWLGSTFWVGANALLRKAALDTIRAEEEERGYRVPRYIQDRTVIEDTESSIDLVARGWRLHNEPMRLAYSATPPDFGALLIQRRRWANGGLLILPRLLSYARSREWRRFGPLEVVVRAHYLLSPALSSIGLLVLLLLPVSEAYISPWLLLLAVPYALVYWRDVLQAGYQLWDYPRIVALNWLLVPVNAAGVVKSLQQGMTGQKIPFGRTPKVSGRTAAPSWAVLALVGLFVYTLAGIAVNSMMDRWFFAAFSLSASMALGYALISLVGVTAVWEDVLPGLASVRRSLAPVISLLGSLGYRYERDEAGARRR